MAHIRIVPLVAAAALVLAACDGGSEPATPSPTEPPPDPATATVAPAATPGVALPDIEPAVDIVLPEGFSAFAVAEGFSQPTSLAFGPSGHLYLSQLDGPVFRLPDTDGDGVYEPPAPYTEEFAGVNGIAFSPDGGLYVSTRGTVSVVRDTDGDAVADTTQEIITGLPNGNHQNNGLAFGPDGKLYFGNGSTCNDCDDVDERSAAILQANPDGSDLRVYASGVRNSYDLVFDHEGRLWATDNGSDPPCNTIDELNLIEDGGDYGWPYEPGCDSFQDGIAPVADLGFNTASTGIDIYEGEQFPAEYAGDFFITLWGNLPFAPAPAGHTLLRVSVAETDGRFEGEVEEFATGFANPIDVLVDSDGTLLVLDFGAGTLYRIIYTGA